MTINIRDIQHYMYCPRRFALLNVNNDWQENAFVVLANIMHENVNSGKHKVISKNKYELSGVYVYDDETDIFGVTDCIEFKPDSSGAYIEELKGNFIVNIIEYKPTKPKNADFNETDAIQAFGYKLCADYIWHCDAGAYIFYKDTRRRVELPFKSGYDKYYALIKQYISGMKDILEKNYIPPREKTQKCSGCSMQDVCMPKTKTTDVKKQIFDALEGEI